MDKSDAPKGQDSTAKDANQSKNKTTGSHGVAANPKGAPTTNKSDGSDTPSNPSKMKMWLKTHVTPTLVVELLVLIVGIRVACIYSGQLEEMRKATKATQLAANAAQCSADLARKQMEGVSAAIIELKQAVPLVSVSGPPAGSEVRFSFTNSGHVIAHNLHVEFTATLSGVEHPTNGKVLVTGNETIPQLPPTSANAYIPDKIFVFEMSTSQAKRITETYDDFIVVKGNFAYDNGFGTVINEPFCNGILWGPSGIGRQFPRCEDIPIALKKLREDKKR